jgi:hypothetical protein
VTQTNNTICLDVAETYYRYNGISTAKIKTGD